MPRFATNEELIAITGLQRQSLRLWVLRGLLPRPTLFSDGRDGVRTRWPASAVERARFVMRMRAQGHKLEDIAEMIKSRWPDAHDDGSRDEAAPTKAPDLRAAVPLDDGAAATGQRELPRRRPRPG